MDKTYTREQFQEWGKRGGEKKAARYTSKQISNMAKRGIRNARKRNRKHG